MGVELDRSRSNCVELEHSKKHRKDHRNTMNYEEWSKSIELDRTLTPKLLRRENSSTEAKIFTEGRKENEVMKIKRDHFQR